MGGARTALFNWAFLREHLQHQSPVGSATPRGPARDKGVGTETEGGPCRVGPWGPPGIPLGAPVGAFGAFHRLILRIEDTDGKRNEREAEAALIDELR